MQKYLFRQYNPEYQTFFISEKKKIIKALEDGEKYRKYKEKFIINILRKV